MSASLLGSMWLIIVFLLNSQARDCEVLQPNIHDAIWSHMIYKLQHVHYKIAQLYVAYDMLYRIELLSIPYDMTKSYATKLQPEEVVLRFVTLRGTVYTVIITFLFIQCMYIYRVPFNTLT